MATNTERLAYRYFTESDNWAAVVDKLNFNFDMTKAFGGGDKGEPGKLGIRGLPGATGIGKKGETGATGATIAFVQVALTDGQAVTDSNLRVGDVVIDSNGSFFKIIENNLGNPVYKFEYSLSAAITGSIVLSENQIANQSTNPIIRWFLRTTGNPKDANALFVDRVVGTVTDEAQLYRVIIGDSGYPLLQNASVAIVNILPNSTVASAKENFFAQLAFKYRSAPNSNVSSNTGYIRYFELNKNETTPAGADDTYMIMENVSAGFGAVHDSITTDASYALVRGRTTRFMGKTAMTALYNNGALNNSFQYVDVIIQSPTEARIAAPNLFRLQAVSGELALSAATLMSFASPKNFFQNALYVGVGNYNGANTYAPANGAVIQGAVGIGVTSAPYTANGVMLHVNGGIKVDPNGAIIWDGPAGNIEHIWCDDNSYQNVGAVFHFVGDAAYKSTGNAGIRSGGIFSERAEFYDRAIIGAAGWTTGFAQGLSVQGRTLLNSIAEVNGKLWGYGGAEFNGVVGMETTNFYTRVGSQVDLRSGEQLYIGAAGINYSIWRYWNNNAGSYEYLGYRGDVNDWRVSWGGAERKLWHSGNQGPGSGLDADTLDGRDHSQFVRVAERSDGDYVWIRTNNGTNQFGTYITRQISGGSGIMGWFVGGGDGSLVAYVGNNGIQYAQDFYILSDRTLKKNIKKLSSVKEIINALSPVTFQWRKSEDQRRKTGFIAQEVQEILPNIVSESAMGLSMSNSDIIPYLVKGLQEAYNEIAELKDMVNRLLNK